MSGRKKVALHTRGVGGSDDADMRAVAPTGRGSAKRTQLLGHMHPSAIRRVTERRVVHLLMRSSSLTRAELGERTGLSLATIGKIIDSLVASGVVEKIITETPKEGRMVGRPAEYYGLARAQRCHVVVEVGVRTTQLAALPVAGPIGDTHTAHFKTANSAMFEKRLRTAVEMLDVADPTAVLVSVPGVVDEAEQRVLYSPNLHWTEGTPLFDAIRRVIPAHLVVVQEIRALALGYLVHCEPHDSFLLVDTGDGVGGALVVDGELQAGPLPLSAELGHTPVPGNRRVCGCGGVGCLETLLGRRGLMRTARRNVQRDLRKWSQLVAELADKQPPAWLRRVLADAACVIAGALNTTGVSRVVLVGDLLELGPGAFELMAERINAHALWGRFGTVRVEAAPRQRLLGLARAALDRVVLAQPAVADVQERRA